MPVALPPTLSPRLRHPLRRTALPLLGALLIAAPVTAQPNQPTHPQTPPAKAESARRADPTHRPDSARQTGRIDTPAPSAPRTGAPDATAPATGSAAAQPEPFASRIEVKAFISDMAEKHRLDRDALLAAFSKITPNTQILALMNPPRTSIQRSWKAYRPRFLQPVRIDGGVRFWNEHADALARASAEYGVPAEIIVAIIGVETVYGRNTGNFQVLQALATLGFDYPSRAAYFKRELEEFLLYCHENGIDPLQPRGSYAGAIGTPQFMPGSIRSFATDFDGDGRIDLRASTVDAIGSVARFLQIHGWEKGKKTHYTAVLAPDANPAPLLAQGPKPTLSIADLRTHGITSPFNLPADEKLLLVDLVNADAPPDYSIGTGNFYAITRYNRSFMYAMAVIDLADAIRTKREQAKDSARPAPQRAQRAP